MFSTTEGQDSQVITLRVEKKSKGKISEQNRFAKLSRVRYKVGLSALCLPNARHLLAFISNLRPEFCKTRCVKS